LLMIHPTLSCFKMDPGCAKLEGIDVEEVVRNGLTAELIGNI
ncbi:9287_t:CDS:1, partial [Dentiscutata erythropus]